MCTRGRSDAQQEELLPETEKQKYIGESERGRGRGRNIGHLLLAVGEDAVADDHRVQRHGLHVHHRLRGEHPGITIIIIIIIVVVVVIIIIVIIFVIVIIIIIIQ